MRFWWGCWEIWESGFLVFEVVNKQVLGWLDGDGLVKVASNLCRLDGCWIEKEVDNSKSFIFWFCCFVYRFLWQLFLVGFRMLQVGEIRMLQHFRWGKVLAFGRRIV